MEDYERIEEYDDAPAQSSIAAPLLRALLFAALAFGIYGLLFGGLLGGSDDLALDPTAAPTTPVAVVPTPTPVPIEPLPTTLPTVAPTVTATPTPATGQVGAGVTVQVIAGAGTTGDQFDAAVAALRELGYDVTEAGISGNTYAQTTVFATAGEEATAQALVAADERFTVVGENPGNLTDQLQIHVLVGEDWPT